MKKEVLYDLDEDNYPKERGKSFYTVQVSRCIYCGALTNRVVMGGAGLSLGARFVCPNTGQEWHESIEDGIDKPALHKDKIKDNLVGEPDLSSLGVTGWVALRVTPEAKNRVAEILEKVRNKARAKKRKD